MTDWLKAAPTLYEVTGDVKDINTLLVNRAALLAHLHARPLPVSSDVDELRTICAEAYQVVGSLLSDLGEFDTPEAEKILDNLSQQRMVHADVLPWPSYGARPLPVGDVTWRPIESAPKDGSHVHLYAPELQFVGFYAEASGWCYVAPRCPLAPTQPTHWMPLPSSPVEERGNNSDGVALPDGAQQ